MSSGSLLQHKGCLISIKRPNYSDLQRPPRSMEITLSLAPMETGLNEIANMIPRPACGRTNVKCHCYYEISTITLSIFSWFLVHSSLVKHGQGYNSFGGRGGCIPWIYSFNLINRYLIMSFCSHSPFRGKKALVRVISPLEKACWAAVTAKQRKTASAPAHWWEELRAVEGQHMGQEEGTQITKTRPDPLGRYYRCSRSKCQFN